MTINLTYLVMNQQCAFLQVDGILKMFLNDSRVPIVHDESEHERRERV